MQSNCDAKNQKDSHLRLALGPMPSHPRITDCVSGGYHLCCSVCPEYKYTSGRCGHVTPHSPLVVTMTLPAGIYCPVVTFFQPTAEQEIDIPAHARHVQFLGRAGIDGVVVQGSTAEAVALTPDERKIVSPRPVLVCVSSRLSKDRIRDDARCVQKLMELP